MTRFLSEALQAKEPYFRLGLRRLEAANGHPNHDIRLSAHVSQAVALKLRTLGLDPSDTTAEELYHALSERIAADDRRVTKKLRTIAATHISAEGDAVAGIAHTLQRLPGSMDCFALKASKLKLLLKKSPPKKAMKELHYRSLDSMLKHEAPALILTAAWLVEANSWRKQLLDQYKKLSARDFETRKIAVLNPHTERWQHLSRSIVEHTKHNVLSFKELGVIVLLPLPRDTQGLVTASLALTVHDLNDIRAASTFLKLCQVRNDFGQLVRSIAEDEPKLTATGLDQAMPWHLVQRFIAAMTDSVRDDLYGPHVSSEDMSWQAAEAALKKIDPELEFWEGTAHLGMLHKHRPVSLNVVDVALNACNNLPFEKRVTQYFKRSLWHELLLRYMNRDTVEQTISSQLQPELAETIS